MERIEPSNVVVNAGTGVTLTAVPNPYTNNMLVFPNGEPRWWASEASTNFTGVTGAVSVVWSAPDGYLSADIGDVTVGAQCGIESAEAQITVVDVGLSQLQCFGESANAGSTGAVAVAIGEPGDKLELSAISYSMASNSLNVWPNGAPAWSGAARDTNQSVSSTAKAYLPIDVLGTYPVTVSFDGNNGHEQATMIVNIVAVGQLQYSMDGGTNWGYMANPTYVWADKPVDFRVLPNPTNCAWPAGKPIWSGALDASGVDSVQETFTAPSTGTNDFKTFHVECGNEVTGNLVVVTVKIAQTNVYSASYSTNNEAMNLTPESWTNVTWAIEDLNGANGAMFADGPTGTGFSYTWTGTNVWISPGAAGTNYNVSAWANELTSCLDTATVHVIAVNIEQSETNLCTAIPNATLNLAENCYWAGSVGGGVVWTSTPAGLAGFGFNDTNCWFTPSNSVPATYVVTAWSSLLTNCLDACTVRVWRVEIAPTNAVVCRQTNSFTFGLTNSYWSGSSVTWTSAPAGLSPAGGSGATFVINPSNSIFTNYTVTAYLADRPDCVSTASLELVHVDIVEPQVLASVGASNVSVRLTSDSSTNVMWIIEPNLGTTGALFAANATSPGTTNVWTGTNVWVWSGLTGQVYTVKAYASQLTNCTDTCTVVIVDTPSLILSNSVATNCVQDVTLTNESRTVGNTLYLCAGTNGTADMQLLFNWLPGDVNSNWFQWKIALTNGDETAQWLPTNAATFAANPLSLTWTNLVNGQSNREFMVNAWFDANTNGTQEDWETHRRLYAVAVDTPWLTLSNAATGISVTDTTWTNEAQSTNNTLYLCETTNGTADMQLLFNWLPENVNSNWFRWKIALTNGGDTAQWSSTNQSSFATNPVAVVWTNLVSGQSNREFMVNAWFDQNTNGTQEDWETHRQLFVIIVKAELTNIKFNHDTGASANDAINIRQDYTHEYDISNGEWVKGGTNIPVCYTTNKAVTIKARFTVEPASITNADIWAISTDSGGSLGDVVRTNVTFSGGVSSPEYVTFQVSGTTPNCIQKTTNDVWQWKMENINGTGSDAWNLNTSGVHTVYTILNEPNHPWANIYNVNSNVWTKVLDKTCDWANGETTAPGVGGDVVEGIYNSGYEYDTGVDDGVGGEPRYYDADKFDLTTCLSEWGNADRDINCWDTANMFAIFSNAGGCDYDLYYITGDFLLNYIKPIGRGWANDPFTDPGRQGFALHWTGWNNIFDPCLQVDDDADPTSAPHTGIFPKNMTFNTGTPTNYDDYRGKLVDPVDEAGVSGSLVQPYGIK